LFITFERTKLVEAKNIIYWKHQNYDGKIQKEILSIRERNIVGYKRSQEIRLCEWVQVEKVSMEINWRRANLHLILGYK